MNEQTFPRASRDDCLRSNDPLQGPYTPQGDWCGHPLYLLVGAVVMVGTVAVSILKPWGWF